MFGCHDEVCGYVLGGVYIAKSAFAQNFSQFVLIRKCYIFLYNKPMFFWLGILGEVAVDRGEDIVGSFVFAVFLGAEFEVVLVLLFFVFAFVEHDPLCFHKLVLNFSLLAMGMEGEGLEFLLAEVLLECGLVLIFDLDDGGVLHLADNGVKVGGIVLGWGRKGGEVGGGDRIFIIPESVGAEIDFFEAAIESHRLILIYITTSVYLYHLYFCLSSSIPVSFPVNQ